MARHYPSEGVKPAENKREAGPKEKKSEPLRTTAKRRARASSPRLP